jgi:hypothetical protein
VEADDYCAMLPFFNISNIELMEATWLDNMEYYGISEIKQLPRNTLQYFRNVKYGRDYCQRTYIALRKPFCSSQKHVQMDLVLCSLVSLLKSGLAELIYFERGEFCDVYCISICFGRLFHVYSFRIYYPRYLAELFGAISIYNFFTDIDPIDSKDLIMDAHEIILSYSNNF